MNFTVVLGTYERLLYGLDISIKEDKYALSTAFIIPAHLGCIHSVACGGRHLATGASDDVIKLFDMKKRKENGTISLQDKPFTSLTFYQHNFMFCSNEDGTITVFQCKDWDPIKTLKASKGFRINDFAVHPSGKLGFSLSKNKSVILWDLIKGKNILKSKSLFEPLKIKFNEDGSRYAILYSDSSIDLFDLSLGALIKSITSPSKIHTFDFLDDDILVYAGEDKILYAYDTTTDILFNHPSEHKLRIREVSIYKADGFDPVLITCSSDGGVKLWTLVISHNDDSIPRDLSFMHRLTHTIDARITCLTLSKF